MTDFKFQIETVEELPKVGGAGGIAKYDWSQFPEPMPGAYPKARIMGIKNSKSLRTSINRYREKLIAEGKKEHELPVFRIVSVKDEKSGETIGFDVYRVPNEKKPEEASATEKGGSKGANTPEGKK